MIKLKDLITETWNSDIWSSDIWNSNIWKSDTWNSHVWEGQESQLNELNIYNRKDLVDSLDSIIKEKGVADKNIIDWFHSTFLNWIYSAKNDEDVIRFFHLQSNDKHKWKPGEPDWTKEENVYDYTGWIEEGSISIRHIIDFFNQMNEEQRKRIKGFSVSQVFELIRRWDETLKKKMDSTVRFTKEGKDIQTVQMFPDGSRFVKLLSGESKDEEGKLMGHCLKSGYQNSHFSLRDSKGHPHVTMEWNEKNNKIIQIKGKKNSPPVKKYIPYIQNFIDKNNFEISTTDAKSLGYVKWKNDYYNIDSEKFKKIYQDEIIPHRNKTFEELKEQIVNGKIGGDVILRGLFLSKLPDFLNGIIIGGNFNCSGNQLTSLQNCPQRVGGSFYCYNNQLTSLQGIPQNVGGSFYCYNNQLTSLQGCPQNIGGNFDCSYNQLTSLQGCPQRVGGYFNCSYNQLTSLQGCPQRVGGYFDCSHNQLTSLQGRPIGVGGYFYCEGNPIK